MFQLLNLAATWWLQTAVLAAIGLTTAISLRKPALQSHVFRVTIVAIFLCPLATQLMSQVGVTLFTVDLQSQFLSQATPAVNESALDHTANNSAEFNVPDFSLELQQSKVEEASASIEPLMPVQPAQQAIALETTSISASAAADSPRSTNWLTSGALTLLLIWVTGAFILLVRLLVDLRRGQILLRESVPADTASDQVCREIATRLQIGSPPRVVVNPFLSSPCLLGHWRPAILLPEVIEPASYDQVFLHELAHLRRSDWLWTITPRRAALKRWAHWKDAHRQRRGLRSDWCSVGGVRIGQRPSAKSGLWTRCQHGGSYHPGARTVARQLDAGSWTCGHRCQGRIRITSATWRALPSVGLHLNGAKLQCFDSPGGRCNVQAW